MIAFASSLDQGGTLTRTAADAALMLQAMAGYDPADSTCADEPVPDYSAGLGKTVEGLRIGVPSEYFGEGLDNDTAEAVRAALKELESLGATIRDISLPHTHLAVPAYYVIAPAECSANLSRFDGVRFGHRCDNPTDLEDMYKRSRGEGFGEEVQRRILVGTYCLSAGFYDAYYNKAQQVRQLIRNDFNTAFKEVDLIMGPTATAPAFQFGSKGDNPVAMYLEDIYTIPANLAGLPGISIPCGLVKNKPVGLQMIGNYFQEGLLLNAAHQFQQITDWHSRRPEFPEEGGTG
jgi:aspartyl-tRNA(Asn)/glutamyl-tRNA(Gln) amidotransferase subunit A